MKKLMRIGAVFVNILLVGLLLLIIYFHQSLPNNYYVTSGTELQLSGAFEAVKCYGNTGNLSLLKGNAIAAGSTFSHKAELRLLGIIPIKVVNVKEVNEPILIPCGEPFGIKMLTDGVVVVEISSFQTEKGFASPATEAGIKIGDIIKTVDGQAVTSNNDIGNIIEGSDGETVSVSLIRDDKVIETEVTPLKCTGDNSFRAGLWVRDSSAGIGTITFYNPATKTFAGLGHPVCDTDTGKILPLQSGEVVKVMINGVKKGKSGSPGELMGMFLSESPIGTLCENSNVGLYGQMDNFSPANEGIPLGMRQEIETGEAFIYSTVKGTTPQKYKIEIEKIDLVDSENCKNMIIRVVDEDLLDASGGIVQGMSGSPIIQNGKLIGAVTHVFVNNPTKGYAIFADSMYNESLKVASDYFVLENAA